MSEHLLQIKTSLFTRLWTSCPAISISLPQNEHFLMVSPPYLYKLMVCILIIWISFFTNFLQKWVSGSITPKRNIKKGTGQYYSRFLLKVYYICQSSYLCFCSKYLISLFTCAAGYSGSSSETMILK